MKANLFILLALFLFGKISAQTIPAEKAYKLNIQIEKTANIDLKQKFSKNKTSLIWKRVKQGEELQFTIKIKAKETDIKNLYIKASDFITQGYMGAISKSSFRFSENEIQNWDPSISVNIKKGSSLTLYGKIHIPKYISPTAYKGTLTIEADGVSNHIIPVTINVSSEYLKN